MAVTFPEDASDYIQVVADSSIDLPDSDWCVSFWETTTDNSGIAFQYLVSTNTSTTAANSMQILFREESVSEPSKLQFILENSSSVDIALSLRGANNSHVVDGTPHLWVIQRVTDDLFIKKCPIGGSVSTEASLEPASNWTAITASELEFGRRADGNADRAYGGTMGHYWQGSFSLSDAEIKALASAQPCSIFDLGYMPNCYWPLQADVSTYPNLISGSVTGAENGDGTDIVDAGFDFPVWQEFVSGALGSVPAAATGGLRNPFQGPLGLRSAIG